MSATRTLKSPQHRQHQITARAVAIGDLLGESTPRELFRVFIEADEALDRLGEELHVATGTPQFDFTRARRDVALADLRDALPTVELKDLLTRLDESDTGLGTARAEVAFLVGFAAGTRLTRGAR